MRQAEADGEEEGLVGGSDFIWAMAASAIFQSAWSWSSLGYTPQSMARMVAGVLTNFTGGSGMPGAGPQTLNSLVRRPSGMEPSWNTLPKPAVK